MGPPLDVVEVVADSLFQSGIASPAIDRRPAREPGLHSVADIIIIHAVFEVLNKFRSLRTRADQTHLPFEDIPELGAVRLAINYL